MEVFYNTEFRGAKATWRCFRPQRRGWGCRCRAELLTGADPDAIGADGTVRLRCYLPSADAVWLSAGREGSQGCQHAAPISIRAAIRLMGTGEATVRQLERRLRCSRCGNRQIGVTVQPDTRTAEAIERDGPAPETRAGFILEMRDNRPKSIWRESRRRLERIEFVFSMIGVLGLFVSC
jgi:hypothetical protein